MKNYKKTTLAVMGMSAVLFAGNAMALTLYGTNVDYELDGTKLGLFGAATVSGDSLILTPVLVPAPSFTAISTTGASALTSALLNVTVTAKNNFQLTAFDLTESGGYTRDGGTVSVSGVFTAEDGFEGGVSKAETVSFLERTSLNAASGTWDTDVNLKPGAGWGENGVVKSVNLTISNYLTVTGGVGEIWKNAVTVNTSVSAVPEAETYAMMLAGLGLVGFMARRTRIAV